MKKKCFFYNFRYKDLDNRDEKITEITIKDALKNKPDLTNKFIK